MSPRMRCLTFLALALCGSSVLEAQSPHVPHMKMRRSNRAPQPVQIDLATGTITRGAPPRPRSAGTVSDFPNLDLSGFYGVDSGGGVAKAAVWGDKGIHGNASDLVNDLTFAYGSAKLDPALGGPGGSVRLDFYEGRYDSAATTAVAVFTLTGLPANSASSSFFGGFTTYVASVKPPELLSFADGGITYAWTFTDLGTDGVLGGTFAGLSCIQGCDGSVPDDLGMYPCYQPFVHGIPLTPPFVGCWSMGFQSLSMDIREVLDTTASAAPFNGDGLNADLLSASVAIVGQDWTSQVALGHPHGSGGLVSTQLRAGVANGPNFSSPVGGRLTESLLTGPRLASFVRPHDGSSSTALSARVPRAFNLVGVTWAAQAVVAGGGFADFSSAVSGVLGTQ